jgi:hypothetical protein
MRPFYGKNKTEIRRSIGKIILFMAVAAVLLLSFHRFHSVLVNHLSTPYDLGIESHNLATIRSLQQGKPIYARGFFDSVPFIITIYNPLYFFLTATMPQSETNSFLTGRIVSLVAAVLTLTLFFLPGRSYGTSKAYFFSLLMIGLILLLPIFLECAVYMHPDMLAIFFSGLAVVTVEKPSNNLRVVLAALFVSLAFGVKQNCVAAMVSCFLYLLFANRRKAALFALATSLFLCGFLGLVQHAWGDGYWFSVFFSVLSHPSHLSLTIERVLELLRYPMFSLLVILVTVTVIHCLVSKRKTALIDSPYFLYVELAGVLPLIGLGKIGGEANYYLEFAVASSLWIVFFLRRYRDDLLPKYVSFFMAALVLAAGLEVTLTKRSSYLLTEEPHNLYYSYHVPEKVKAEIMELAPRNNRFLVLNAHVMLPFLTETYFNDPYNYFLMWNSGILDPKPMVQVIEKKVFSVILFAYEGNPYKIPGMYSILSGPGTERILKALLGNYRLSKVGAFLYFTPIELSSPNK